MFSKNKQDNFQYVDNIDDTDIIFMKNQKIYNR